MVKIPEGKRGNKKTEAENLQRRIRMATRTGEFKRNPGETNDDAKNFEGQRKPTDTKNGDRRGPLPPLKRR